MMFTVTVKYFGSHNEWTRDFHNVDEMYSYMDAVKPFISYSKVTDSANHMCVENYYNQTRS